MNRRMGIYILIILFLFSLYPLSRYNYLLFHTFVEFFTMIVSVAIFLLAWNTQDLIKESYLLFLGVGYLFIAIITFFHAITFYGINIFPELGPNTATQFWMLGRFLETFVLFMTPFWVGKKVPHKKLRIFFTGMGLFTFAGITSILIIPVFPPCFIKGVGLTPFKVYSEYLIIAILLFSLFYLYRSPKIKSWFFKDFSYAISLSILAEISFTLYTDVYGFFNFLGHTFYLISFYFIYRIIIARGLKRPTTTLFEKLNKAQEHLQAINSCLLSFDRDYQKNMRRILKGVGELFQAAGVSFNEIQGEDLRVLAQWKISLDYLSYPIQDTLSEKIISREGLNPLYLPDLHNSPYLLKDPYLQQYSFTSALGVPILVEGQLLGTLTLFFQEERHFSLESFQTLTTFSQTLGDELKKCKVDQEIKRGLERARDLQMALFPKKMPLLHDMVAATSFIQAEETSGDYFNLYQDGHEIFFFMVDVTGHGLDAALITVFVSTLFRREMEGGIPSPEAFLKRLWQDFLVQGFPDDYSLEVFCGRLDIKTRDFSYGSAGSIRALKFNRDDGSIPLPDSHGTIINNSIQKPVLGRGQGHLYPGEALIIFTDGLDEPFLQKEDAWKKKMYHFQKIYRLLSFQDFLDRILGDLKEDIGEGQIPDDMAIMGFYSPREVEERTWIAPKELQAIPAFLHTILEEISSFIEDPTLIQMALTEAINNGVVHAKQKVEVKGIWSPEDLLFWVRDDGPGFQWKNELKNKETLLNMNKERGRGLTFISLATHDFTLNIKGNAIAMLWNLAPGNKEKKIIIPKELDELR